MTSKRPLLAVAEFTNSLEFVFLLYIILNKVVTVRVNLNLVVILKSSDPCCKPTFTLEVSVLMT
jgi:hypothetical protein